MSEESDRYREAIERFDALNRNDPHVEVDGGRPSTKELVYGQRMTRVLNRFAPHASETVRLASRAQHICRWEIPRDAYPIGREGYRRWRSELGRFHAETAGRVLRQIGYDPPVVARVQALLRKERLKADANCQLLEDVICLVFIQYYLVDFAAKHNEAKLLNILRRTWKKMSTRGQAAAVELDLSSDVRVLLDKAIIAES